MNGKEILKSLKQFGQETTIQGAFILAKYKLHILERLFWISIITLAAGSAIVVCLSNWNHYSANPTVVSLRKDFRNWNNPFPAATGCFLHKTDEAAADEFIKKTWNVNYSHPRYDYYLDFVKAVANISFESLDVFARFQNDRSLNNVDMMELAAEVHPKLTGTLVTFDTKRPSKWKLVVTEMGVCFTLNAQFAEVISFRGHGVNNKVEDSNDKENIPVLRCHYMNGLCYARYDSDPDAPVNFYVHSYLDILHATHEAPWYAKESQELEINYRIQETVSDVSLRSLTPSQRKCRFENEPITKDVPVYSRGICYMVCRYKLVMRLCGCRPYFYNNLGGKVCNASGLSCVAKHAHVLMQPPSKLGCDCPQSCNIIMYLPQIPKINHWEYGYFDQRITFRWGLLPPTTKYHRNVLFGFEDLVVSFGGTIALFLGISFMSLIEVILFMIENALRLCSFWLLKNKKPNGKKLQSQSEKRSARRINVKSTHVQFRQVSCCLNRHQPGFRLANKYLCEAPSVLI